MSTAAAEKTPFVPGPIAAARDYPLSDSSSGQPIMAEAILDWFRPLVIGIITSTIQDGSDDETQDGVAKEVERDQRTSGCIQPGKAEQLDMKAEGERSWDSALLHTTPDFDVDTDTVIRVKGTRFRVMAKRDFSANGYIRYELTQDYADPS